MPDVLLCGDCHAQVPLADQERCARCEELYVLQNKNADLRLDLEMLMSALEQAASELESTAQRTRAESSRASLNRAALQARAAVVDMWEKYFTA